PNYEGTIREGYWQENAGLNRARTILEKFTHRLSAQVSYLKQLLEAEQYKEGIEFVKQLGTVQDVHLTNYLGWAYVGNRQFQQALTEFTKASQMPGHVAQRGSIQRGLKLCEQQLSNKAANTKQNSVETPQRNLQIAQAFWKLTFYRKAQRYAQKVLESQNADEQTSDKARLILARFDLINGQPEQATAQLKQIQDHENKEYQSLSERLELEKMLAELKPDQQEAVLKLASLYQ
ncbi:MAG: hypothetical protein RLO18_24960, partial [Gimesia chilikensis]